MLDLGKEKKGNSEATMARFLTTQDNHYISLKIIDALIFLILSCWLTFEKFEIISFFPFM